MNRRHSLPAEVYALVERTPATVLLECGKAQSENSESWTQLFVEPVRVCMAHTAAELSALFADIENSVAAGFVAAGFFSYECGACFEPKARLSDRGGNLQPREQLQAQLGRPLAWFGIYERGYRFDHSSGRFVDGAPPGLKETSPPADLNIESNFAITEDEYAQRIDAIHELIRAGDVYQLNFTAPLRIKTTSNAASLYGHLRVRQPVEYGAFLHTQDGRYILSLSPELFFRIDEQNGARRIETRPMKGTAPRGRTTSEDWRIAEWLRNDPKNRAENLMIVDLLRNDLGRLARFGSVRVNELFAIERYPTLWQMYSIITAELQPEISFSEIFRALFPCGSITGAPKVRAMQLLAQLEEQPRGVYTGAIGHFSPTQTVFNVAIRTIELQCGQGVMGVGSGIVIDSDAAGEYRECMLKAEFITRSSQASSNSATHDESFSLIETILWDGGYPLLDLHLDRLTDSAAYFDFPCDRAAVKAALESRACAFTGGALRKVRLLLDANGDVQIADEILPASDAMRVGRVRISGQHTDSGAPMLFHKTTDRALYAQELKVATQAHCDDVLFLNERGEVTEGAISNVFIEKNGRLLTPSLDCGLLAGVYRRHMLETRANIEERILYLDDLRNADAVYITNAVRGLRRVEIDWEG